MTKKLSIILFSMLGIVLAISCNKEPDFNYPEGMVGRSRITFFPTFEMTGDPVMSIVKGTPWTDPGIKATEAGAEIPVTTTGAVNPDEVGLYTLTYSATNRDGFSASTTRTVVVIPDHEIPGLDISGEYLPIGGAPANAIITKQAEGVYFTTNCWGGGSLAVIPAYFICVDGATVQIPLQDPGSGRIVTEHPGTFAGGLISWTVTRLDFPGGPLVRDKKWQKL
jgi:hypothetical protein